MDLIHVPSIASNRRFTKSPALYLVGDFVVVDRSYRSTSAVPQVPPVSLPTGSCSAAPFRMMSDCQFDDRFAFRRSKLRNLLSRYLTTSVSPSSLA